jgi:PTH1 family peptidyl-tRNA hydrolase
MSSHIKLIVGLGNPGSKYAKTRHNAGFWFVDELLNCFGGEFKSEAKFSGEVAKTMIGHQSVWVLKPSTFMNRSGLAAHQLASFYKISVEEILVAHDELDLEPGTVRLKSGGGHGGHNGLRDLHAQIGKNYWRLRLGIGHPGDRDKVVDYVLSKPSKDDDIAIHNSIDQSLAVIEEIVMGETQKAMNTLHSDR